MNSPPTIIPVGYVTRAMTADEVKFFLVSSDVSGSRASDGTVYQNTSTKPMLVSVRSGSDAQSVLSAKTDAATPPTVEVAAFGLGAGIGGNLTFLVLPNHYYKVSHNAGTPTLYVWNEWV